MGRGRPLRFSGSEQRVMLGLLLSPCPLSAWQLAGWLSRPYCDTKRVVRGLAAEMLGDQRGPVEDPHRGLAHGDLDAIAHQAMRHAVTDGVDDPRPG
jgi:hypothetical protein